MVAIDPSLLRAQIQLPTLYEELSDGDRIVVRLRYAVMQQYCCMHCEGSLSEPSKDKRLVDTSRFPENFFEHAHHLHHDHATGLTLGCVHAHCNAVLWEYYGE